MIKVNATGCLLLDKLYNHIPFNSKAYRSSESKNAGDGGLVTGGLTFAEALSEFANTEYPNILSELTEGREPDNSSIGGPGIVPIIHCAQVCRRKDIHYRFAGVLGQDANGKKLRELLNKTHFPDDDLTVLNNATPCTDVLSDQNYKNGQGERTFINTIGAAGAYGMKCLPADFFNADFLQFGGTALLPPLHDNLDELCGKGKKKGAFIMVNTVFDFRNEAKLKGKPWPLVENYSNIDLLAVDREESLKISGQKNPQEALQWFLNMGCGAIIITQGVNDVLMAVNNNSSFRELSQNSMPTCRYADNILKSITAPRDTTGCGDNFVGGLIDSLAHQMAERQENQENKNKLNLEEAVISATAASSLALTCLGGVYYENEPGEKLAIMQPYFEAYRKQLAEGRKN